MSPPSSTALVAHLCQSPLLTATQRGEIERLQAQFPDPKGLAQHLLQRGWLTPYQLNQLFLGRGSDLVLGSYVILERLGEGGAGQVFKARHLHMDRVVALKVIRKEALTDPEIVGRFRREIHAVSQLNHPNVVHAYDAGPVGPNFFLAMEYVEGIDLQRLVTQTGPLAVPQACEYVRQVAEGLQYVHEKGLVHRDIKPSNLLLTQNHGQRLAGVVKILDLGLARLRRPLDHALTSGLTATGAVMMGTLDYMAPEQALDFHTVDIRADIYSLGCTCYFLLTRQAPFTGGTAAQVLLAHQQKTPPPLESVRRDVLPGLAGIVARMMAKRPEERYQTPGEICRELSGQGGAAVSVQAPGLQRALLPVPVQSMALPAIAVPAIAVPAIAVPVVVHDVDRSPPGNAPRLRGLLPAWKPQPSQWRRRYWLVGGVVGCFLLALLLLAAGVRKKTEQKYYVADMKEAELVCREFGKNGKFGNGERMLVDGNLATKGLYMHHPHPNPAVAAYRLGKQYQRFKATVALFDNIGEQGGLPRAVFMVKGDDKVLWQSAPIERPRNLQQCDVSVAGLEQLELIVVFTGNSYWAKAIWVDPYLTK